MLDPRLQKYPLYRDLVAGKSPMKHMRVDALGRWLMRANEEKKKNPKEEAMRQMMARMGKPMPSGTHINTMRHTMRMMKTGGR